ncbi:hypothetical protein G6F22_021728 [Rhizopus arrhizus]|nr:hypothetical protein G6F22_021728 [Rhizopus arrhizus]
MRQERLRNAGHAALAHCRQYRLGGAGRPQVLVGAGNDYPGRVAAVGVVQHNLAACADAVVLLVDLQVDGADLPRGFGAGQEALCPLLLRLG